MTEILYYAFIFPLEQILDFILGFIFNFTHSYGASIVLLSLLVNVFLLKIFLYTDKKAQSESELKSKLDKRIKAWKSVYKKAKLYAFTQTLYRQNRYHPIFALRSLGGLLIQIPFFLAMYEVIKKADYLSGVGFLWIDDLSKADSIGFASLHLLPILMTLFTLINVFYSVKELNGRIQGVIIALLFLVLLYNMPSALVLYWTCNMLFALLKEVYKKLTHHHISQAQTLPQALQQNSSYQLLQYTFINLFLMIFLFAPYNLYVSDLNAFSLDSIPLTLSALFGFFMISVFIVLYVLSFIRAKNIVSKVIVDFLAWFFSAVALLGFIYGFILRGDYGLMSYFFFDKQVVASPTQKLIDDIMIVSVLIAAIFVMRYKGYAIYTHRVIFIVLIVGTIIPLTQAVVHIVERDSAQALVKHNDRFEDMLLFSFSKDHRNVLVLILDRSDGYVANEIFRVSKDLQKSFSGFIQFNNALSSGDYTLLTLTSVIAGEYYTALNINKRQVSDTLRDEIARGYANIFNAFIKEGYAVSGILDYPTDEEHIYPLLQQPHGIIFDTSLMKNVYIDNISNSSKLEMPLPQLISYGIFRISTFRWRLDVYQHGFWLFNKTKINYSIRAIAELDSFASYINANAAQPTFKFIHNSITHNPYGMDSNCAYSPKENTSLKDNEYGLPEGHYNAEKCAWHFVASMLDRLKELGVYDNTEIFITADHGAQRRFLPINMNVHIPFFYKPLNSKGVMKQDKRVVVNYDIPTIFCTHLKNGCLNVDRNILDNLPTHKEVIVSSSHNWRIETNNKNSLTIDSLYRFKGSDIYNPNSWQKLEGKDLDSFRDSIPSNSLVLYNKKPKETK